MTREVKLRDQNERCGLGSVYTRDVTGKLDVEIALEYTVSLRRVSVDIERPV